MLVKNSGSARNCSNFIEERKFDVLNRTAVTKNLSLVKNAPLG